MNSHEKCICFHLYLTLKIPIMCRTNDLRNIGHSSYQADNGIKIMSKWSYLPSRHNFY